MSYPALDGEARSTVLLLIVLIGIAVLAVFGPLAAGCYVAFAVALVFGRAPIKGTRAASVDLAGCTDCPGCGSHQTDIIRADETDDGHELRWACFSCDSTWAIH